MTDTPCLDSSRWPSGLILGFPLRCLFSTRYVDVNHCLGVFPGMSRLAMVRRGGVKSSRNPEHCWCWVSMEWSTIACPTIFLFRTSRYNHDLFQFSDFELNLRPWTCCCIFLLICCNPFVFELKISGLIHECLNHSKPWAWCSCMVKRIDTEGCICMVNRYTKGLSNSCKDVFVHIVNYISDWPRLQRECPFAFFLQ